jgi:hypothetical protein
MKRAILPSAAVLLGLFLAWCYAPESEPFHPAELVCFLDTPTGNGSAVPIAVTPEGFTVLLTARHVVEDLILPSDLTVSLRRGLPVPATRVEPCPDLDLALIWVQKVWPIVPFDLQELHFGDRVQGSGYFFNGPLMVSDGVLSERDIASVEAFPGCSGGAVLREGRLVGIIHSSGRVGVKGGMGSVPVGGIAIFVSISDALPWIRATL